MKELFFLVSGEHPTLPFYEIRAILEAEGYRYEVLEELTQALRLKADEGCIKRVAFRAAFTRACCLEIFRCKGNHVDIHKRASEAPFEDLLKPGDEFVVRVRRVCGASPHVSALQLERELGDIVLSRAKGVKVNVKRPQKTLFGVLTKDAFILGLRLAEVSPKPFSVNRKPSSRPFSHPSLMPAKLARCMVNLARARENDVVLDPFCGTGSMLIEAGLVGCYVLGSDVKRRMVEGSLRNLSYFGIKPLGMAVADARRLPFPRADRIVTDPPYGRSATTMGLTTRRIVYDFLNEAKDVLQKGGYVCISSPKDVRISDIGCELGYRHVESHFVYIHRGLTREIAVLKKV